MSGSRAVGAASFVSEDIRLRRHITFSDCDICFESRDGVSARGHKKGEALWINFQDVGLFKAWWVVALSPSAFRSLTFF